MRMTRWLALVCVAASAACTSSDTPTQLAPPQVDRWAAVDSVIRAQIATAGGTGNLTVAVYNQQNDRVFERTYGTFTPDQRVAVASASKLISGLVLLDVVARGELTLESTTASVLGWTGAHGTITLRHLLSFTSGLEIENGCTFNPLVTLSSCVATIASAPMRAAPGTRYDYGSTHLHVAARMAEIVTGKSWNTLFRERIADPLALPTGVRYFTFPIQGVGEANPLIAGGLRASAREYARMLALAYQLGRYDGVTIGSSALLLAQAREPYPSVTVGASPAVSLGQTFRYGLSAWLECNTPATGCAVISSAGAFGFTPWLDRDTRYYATIAMEQTDGRGTGFSVRLQQALIPFIKAALAAN